MCLPSLVTVLKAKLGKKAKGDAKDAAEEE